MQNYFDKPLFDPTYLNLDYFFNKILEFFQWVRSLHAGSAILFASYLLSLFGITIIIYSIVRLIEIQKEEAGHLAHQIAEVNARHHAKEKGQTNPRWEHITALMHSPNPSDWRFAIIEADSMLEELLNDRGYFGAGIGEKLRNAGSGGFSTIARAGEAHGTRNRIAHEGSNFDLSEREARAAIGKYEDVFREFGII